MLVYFRALFSSGKLLDSHWKMMNKMSQEATFEVAHQEGLTTLADMRLDGHVLAVFHPDPALRSDEQSKSTAFALQHEPCLHTMPLLAHATVTAQDGQGSCSAYTHGLSQAVMTKLNVSIKCSAPVKRLLVHSGQVYGVQTQSGQEIHADGVVVCAGASSTELLFSAGVYVPIQPLRGYSVTAPALSGALRTHMIIKPYDLYITRLGDTIRFASYGELTATGTVESSEELEQRLIELVEFACPSVRKWCRWDAAQVWIGSRPLTPDCQPLVGPTCIRRLWINAGHSFHGWRDAAHSGRVLTASVLGVPPPGKEFSSLFLPSRFQPLCM
jgi:D-amino-acid dehydrogenase